MPAYKSGKKTQQYPTEFKVTAVRLSLRDGSTVKSVALSLDIHPYMLSKWRKDYREGVIMEDKRKKRTQFPSQKAGCACDSQARCVHEPNDLSFYVPIGWLVTRGGGRVQSELMDAEQLRIWQQHH